MDGDLTQNTEKNTRHNFGTNGFDKRGQPSPQAKKRGWERRRQAQQLMDRVLKYQKMKLKKFMEILDDIKVHPEKYTMGDVLAIQYVAKSYNKDKFLLDFFDRHVSKAPQNVDITTDDQPIKQEGFKVIVVNTREEAKQYGEMENDAGDSGLSEESGGS
jgi:hypothetical protein